MAAARLTVRVAAIQWANGTLASPAALEDALREPLRQAAGRGAELVAFPGTVSDTLAAALARVAYAAGGGHSGPAMTGLALQHAMGESLSLQLQRLGCSLAREHGVTLSLGPVLAQAPAGPERIAYVFGPQGEVLGAQRQTHRTAAEVAAGLVRGMTLAPVPTPVGLVGLLSGADVFYPEVARILCLQGAVLLVHHDPDPLTRFDEGTALSRFWREVQANQVFGIEVYEAGQWCRGLSAIHAPLEIVPDHTGWLARAPNEGQPAIVLADLDLAALSKLRQVYPIHGLRNVGQYRRYLPALYEGASNGQSGGHGGA